jgi:hypothetical protein
LFAIATICLRNRKGGREAPRACWLRDRHRSLVRRRWPRPVWRFGDRPVCRGAYDPSGVRFNPLADGSLRLQSSAGVCMSISTGPHVTPDSGVVINPSSLGTDARSQARDRPQRRAPLQVTPISTSVRQFDAGRLRTARPPAQRTKRADALGRVKYTLPIDGRGPPGHRVTQAWLRSLAQSDAASSGTSS